METIFLTYQINENIVRVGAVAIFRSKCSFFQNVFQIFSNLFNYKLYFYDTILCLRFCKLLKQGLLQNLCVKSVKTWWSVEHLIQWSKCFFLRILSNYKMPLSYTKFANYFAGSQYHCLFLNCLKIDESYEIS